MAKKDLMQGALNPKSEIGAPKGKIYMSDGTTYDGDKDAQAAYNDLKELHNIETSRKIDADLQAKVDEYNRQLPNVDPMFEGITIPENMVIVKLARLPHLDKNTGFVIPRVITEPSRSGADVPGKAINNTYPYYDFGYVVKSTSKWVPEKQFAQLSYDAIMQQFQREEGKWRYYMPNEFTFWNNRKEERSKDTLDCYVYIRDYQVEAVFDKKYKPVYD